MVPGRKTPHDHHAVSPLRLTEAPSASCLGGDMAAPSVECAACIGPLGTGIHRGDGGNHGPGLVAGAPLLGPRISMACRGRASQRCSGSYPRPSQVGEFGTAFSDGAPIRAGASWHGREPSYRSWTSLQLAVLFCSERSFTSCSPHRLDQAARLIVLNSRLDAGSRARLNMAKSRH